MDTKIAQAASTRTAYTSQAINAVLAWVDTSLREARRNGRMATAVPLIMAEANRAISAWEDWAQRGNED